MQSAIVLNLHRCGILCLAALNFDLYGQVLSQSYSVSAFAGRQSPSGLSLGSDVSGNSADTGQKE